MKKIICFALSGLTALTLAACSDSSLAEMTTSEGENYSAIVWDNKTYVPFCAVSKDECGGKIGIVNGDKKDMIYEYDGYPPEEWIINYYPMAGAMLYKEISVTNIPDGLSSEYEWNRHDKSEEMMYTFKRTQTDLQCEPAEEQILRLGSEKDSYLVDGETGALILGKIWRLFGEPDQSGSSEVFYLYKVEAAAPDKEPAYLMVDQYNDKPTIRYSEGGEEAARQLAEAIRSAEPADYELSAVYDDYFIRMIYFVKDGKPGSREEKLTLKEILGEDASPEDIEEFKSLMGGEWE